MKAQKSYYVSATAIIAENATTVYETYEFVSSRIIDHCNSVNVLMKNACSVLNAS